MKTAKTVSRQKKSNMDKEPIKNKKTTEAKKGPGEEDIRQKALEIYHMRIKSGEHGTPADDWFEAERVLGESE
jgi:hypothetical protein